MWTQVPHLTFEGWDRGRGVRHLGRVPRGLSGTGFAEKGRDTKGGGFHLHEKDTSDKTGLKLLSQLKGLLADEDMNQSSPQDRQRQVNQLMTELQQ